MQNCRCEPHWCTKIESKTYYYLYNNLSEIDNNCIYDLVIGKEVGKCKNEIKGFVKLNTDNHIVTGKYLQTYIYIYIKTDFTLLWQKEM